MLVCKFFDIKVLQTRFAKPAPGRDFQRVRDGGTPNSRLAQGKMCRSGKTGQTLFATEIYSRIRPGKPVRQPESARPFSLRLSLFDFLRHWRGRYLHIPPTANTVRLSRPSRDNTPSVRSPSVFYV